MARAKNHAQADDRASSEHCDAKLARKWEPRSGWPRPGEPRPDASAECRRALDVFSADMLWTYLCMLEPPAASPPRLPLPHGGIPPARIEGEQEARDTVARVARDIEKSIAELVSLCQLRPDSGLIPDAAQLLDLAACERVMALLDSRISAGTAYKELRDAIEKAGEMGRREGRGSRGPLNRASRIRRFSAEVCEPLRQYDRGYWTWSRFQVLILASDDDWTRPPCSEFVASLSDGTDLARALMRAEE